ncbi:MAG: citrate/2-methylcitrate synthase [Lachnospiraceae bacterium]|nr:citrate/2-methylcitrate synthase [Lachnospiraceae bacterium]
MERHTMMELGEELDLQFNNLVEHCMRSGEINQDLYSKFDVKRGLRDSNGKGVLTGLTEVSDVVATKIVDGEMQPVDGELYFQGINVQDLIQGGSRECFYFEEATYLLLFGRLPSKEEFDSFVNILGSLRELSGQFVRDVIMKAPPANLMNALQKCIVLLYSYDANPDSIDVPNVLRQSLQLIAKLPMMAVYSYYAYRHFQLDKTLVVRPPKTEYSTAENILYMLRKDGKFTKLEAKVLDIALVLHAEHGGGNNSTFTNHVVTSSGTDTYSAVAASMSSLKGHRHGGANLKVMQMFDDLKEHCRDCQDEEALTEYLIKILDKEVFDKAGLIYGMGHAVYTNSDPREVILKKYAKRLSEETGMQKEFELYTTVERISGKLIAKRRKLFKPICANVDFYSGLVYTMLGIPRELFTPMFAIARISGWSAHRLEELVNKGKIIRPAYKFVGEHREFSTIEHRK